MPSAPIAALVLLLAAFTPAADDQPDTATTPLLTTVWIKRAS